MWRRKVRKIILHAFGRTEEARQAFQEARKKLAFDELSFRARLSIESPKQIQLFRRVASLDDAYALAGYHLTEVRWRHKPEDPIAIRIAYLIRSPQHA